MPRSNDGTVEVVSHEANLPAYESYEPSWATAYAPQPRSGQAPYSASETFSYAADTVDMQPFAWPGAQHLRAPYAPAVTAYDQALLRSYGSTQPDERPGSYAPAPLPPLQRPNFAAQNSYDFASVADPYPTPATGDALLPGSPAASLAAFPIEADEAASKAPRKRRACRPGYICAGLVLLAGAAAGAGIGVWKSQQNNAGASAATTGAELTSGLLTSSQASSVRNFSTSGSATAPSVSSAAATTVPAQPPTTAPTATAVATETASSPSSTPAPAPSQAGSSVLPAPSSVAPSSSALPQASSASAEVSAPSSAPALPSSSGLSSAESAAPSASEGAAQADEASVISIRPINLPSGPTSVVVFPSSQADVFRA